MSEDVADGLQLQAYLQRKGNQTANQLTHADGSRNFEQTDHRLEADFSPALTYSTGAPQGIVLSSSSPL